MHTAYEAKMNAHRLCSVLGKVQSLEAPYKELYTDTCLGLQRQVNMKEYFQEGRWAIDGQKSQRLNVSTSQQIGVCMLFVQCALVGDSVSVGGGLSLVPLPLPPLPLFVSITGLFFYILIYIIYIAYTLYVLLYFPSASSASALMTRDHRLLHIYFSMSQWLFFLHQLNRKPP